MKRFLQPITSFFKSKDSASADKSKDSASAVKSKNPAFSKAKQHGKAHETELVNETDFILYCREKIGAAYGGLRCKIPAHDVVVISALQHTFFQMLVFAEASTGMADPESNVTASSLTSPQREGKKDLVRTNIIMDGDQLADCSKIVIRYDGSMFSLEETYR